MIKNSIVMKNKIESFIAYVLVMLFITIQRFSPVYNLFVY